MPVFKGNLLKTNTKKMMFHHYMLLIIVKHVLPTWQSCADSSYVVNHKSNSKTAVRDHHRKGTQGNFSRLSLCISTAEKVKKVNIMSTHMKPIVCRSKPLFLCKSVMMMSFRQRFDRGLQIRAPLRCVKSPEK